MDSEDSNTTLMARMDLLGKLSSAFDQLAPNDKIGGHSALAKGQLIDSMRVQEKAIVHLQLVKDKMKDQIIARKAN